jgi:hypothetical protein
VKLLSDNELNVSFYLNQQQSLNSSANKQISLSQKRAINVYEKKMRLVSIGQPIAVKLALKNKHNYEMKLSYIIES